MESFIISSLIKDNTTTEKADKEIYDKEYIFEKYHFAIINSSLPPFEYALITNKQFFFLINIFLY